MEKRIISIEVSPETENEYFEKTGIMWEHNATVLQFKIAENYVGDYSYYIEYRSILGTKVRTEYLELDRETNTVTYDIPVTMSSLKGVECYFNAVRFDEDGNTIQVIKPKKFGLTFDYSPDTDNFLAKVNDFSINALLEAIRTGTFKGERGEKGEKGEIGNKGEQGDGVNNLFDCSVNLYNEKTNIPNKIIDINTGELTDNSQYVVTDFIYLKKGQYTMTFIENQVFFTNIARYTVNKEFIPGSRVGVTKGSLEIAQDCYVRFSGYPARMENKELMLVRGTELPAEYVPHYIKLKKDNVPHITKDMLDDCGISREKTDFLKTSDNLINHMTVTNGKVISPAGVLTDNAQYCITDKMLLKKSTVYTARKLLRISYFKENGDYVNFSALETSDYSPKTFTTRDDFDYAIISLPKNSIVKDEWQLYEGDTVPEEFEKQHLIIDGYRVYDKPDVAVDPIVEFRNKDRMVFDKAPLFTLDEDVEGIDTATQRNSASIFSMYDDLKNSNPSYITKTELGADSMGNMLYRYDFKEPDVLHSGATPYSTVKPKVILISGVHNEFAGIYSLFNAMKQIATNPKLADLRSNIHFIVVPVVNIYGINNNKRKNENGIDLARNFEVDFVVGTDTSAVDYGGTEPLSELACQYIDTLMKENSDAIFFNSCHNFATNDVQSKSFMWGCSATKYFNNISNKVIIKLSREWADKYDFITTSNGYISGNGSNKYLGSAEASAPAGSEGRQAMKYSIQGGSFEVCDYFHFKSSNEADTSFVLSRGAETYINLILAHVYNYDMNF